MNSFHTHQAGIARRPRGEPSNHEELLSRFEIARRNHMGYPYNLAFSPKNLSKFNGYLINNLGDPYVGSHYATEVCDLEMDIINWAQKVWQCPPDEDFWGSVVASGTEGNLWAIYLGREALHDAALICSRDAHYSIPKAARIMGIECVTCDSNETGEICLMDLQKKVASLAGRGLIIALTCGTTMRGAHDDILGCLEVLEQAGVSRNRRYLHVDGALNGMVIPFLENVESGIIPSFKHEIDSISASGHKMIGTPMPCGILVARRNHVNRIASSISYLRSNDTTLMGSRNGHASIAIWERIVELGEDGFQRETQACLARATRLAQRLRQMGVPVLQNKHSLTLVFPKPNDDIVKMYQLACDGELAHAIVMPNVNDELINRFIHDYEFDFSARRSRPGIAAELVE
ncbi:histidine decarboxylase [Mesorhizobium metallidurans]|nr:histidine decarboxylase [Mesorhizobium metallidurans]